MRFDAETEQKKFWKIFDEKLIENGEPFSILHEKAGKVTHWAMINKNYSPLLFSSTSLRPSSILPESFRRARFLL